MLKFELKKSLSFIVLLLLTSIGIFVNLSGAYDNISPSINIEKGSDSEGLSEEAIDGLKNMANEYQNTYMAWQFGVSGYEIVCILLASSVFAISYIIDKKSGFLKNIIIRLNKKSYYKIKYFVNGVLGGIIVIIPVILCLGLYDLFLDSKSLPIIEPNFPRGFMSEYFPTNPVKYILFFTLILFIIGVTYSTFAMAIGIITNNIISSVLLPVIYWFAGSLILESIGLIKLAPWNIYYFKIGEPMSFEYGLIHLVVIFIISSFIIFKESKNDLL
ncbi:MAG: hypothetical protein RSD36_14200 [Terrisporobacter sp.]